MIRAVLADDEEPGRKRLRRLLAEHPDVEIVAEAETGRSARAAVLAHRPDVLFLDVQMPGETGPDALRLLRASVPEGALPHVVFTTAHAEHALDAFALEAIDYLLKPVERDGIARALKRVRGRLDGPEPPPPAPRLLAHRGTRTLPLDGRQVHALVVEDETVWAWSTGERYRVDGALQEVAERLPGLVPVSRSAWLRPEAIVALRPLASGTWEATVQGVEGVVHVSRRRARALRPLLSAGTAP